MELNSYPAHNRLSFTKAVNLSLELKTVIEEMSSTKFEEWVVPKAFRTLTHL